MLRVGLKQEGKVGSQLLEGGRVEFEDFMVALQASLEER